MKVNSCFDGKLITLSNGQQYKDGDYVWIEVSPIKWLVDKENDIAISKEILFSGIQCNDRLGDYKNFKDTVYYWYLNTYFIKEIMNYKNRKADDLLNQLEETIGKQKDEIATLKKIIRNNINTKKIPVKVRTNKKNNIIKKVFNSKYLYNVLK